MSKVTTLLLIDNCNADRVEVYDGHVDKQDLVPRIKEYFDIDGADQLYWEIKLLITEYECGYVQVDYTEIKQKDDNE